MVAESGEMIILTAMASVWMPIKFFPNAHKRGTRVEGGGQGAVHHQVTPSRHLLECSSTEKTWRDADCIRKS